MWITMKRVTRPIVTGRKKLEVRLRYTVVLPCIGSLFFVEPRSNMPLTYNAGSTQDNGPVCIVRAGDGKRKLQCVVPMGDHVRNAC